MRIIITCRTAYTLQNEQGCLAGSLIYTNNSLAEALLKYKDHIYLVKKLDGRWYTTNKQNKEMAATAKVKMGGTIELVINGQYYNFKKPLNWKLRFVLLNAENEEMLALLPQVNWNKRCYDFVLQLNDELISESDSFVILQALHCAVCSMAMLNGTLLPMVGYTT